MHVLKIHTVHAAKIESIFVKGCQKLLSLKVTKSSFVFNKNLIFTYFDQEFEFKIHYFIEGENVATILL